MSRTVKDSGLRADFPVSNITPRRMTGVRSGVNRIGQPAASTRVPGAVPGQRSFASSTPSLSESRKRWHPTSSTSAPGGVLGHLSSPSGTPSLSESSGQPAGSTTAPAGVPGHWSRPSSTPSPSASAGQPLASTRAPAGVPGHWSRPSSTPSPSASAGQPLALTRAPAGVPGHWSSPSYTPSRSESVGHPCASTVAPTGVSGQDRKSTRLNSSHVSNSYAVFCLKKKRLTQIYRACFLFPSRSDVYADPLVQPQPQTYSCHVNRIEPPIVSAKAHLTAATLPS